MSVHNPGRKEPAIDAKEKEERDLAETQAKLFGPRYARSQGKPESKHLNDDFDVEIVDGSATLGGPVEVEETFDLDLGDIDITTNPDVFDEKAIDEDLINFQKDDLVKAALQKGVDLRVYSRQIEADLREAEADCIREYIKESDELAGLHTQIKQCDQILETMERMLGRFQGDLGAISSEIQHLQDRSVSMNIKLRNSKAAEELLSNFIQQIYVSPEFAKAINESDLNADYDELLKSLGEKIKFVSLPDVYGTRAAEDVAPNIERLRQKAVARIRSFVLHKFHSFKKPMTNIKAKQDVLIKNASGFYHFLVGHAQAKDQDVASECRQHYVDTMSKIVAPAQIYYDKFKTYLTSLKKLQLESTMTKTDLLGLDESKTGGFFSSKRTNEQLVKLFALGTRDSVLTDLEKDPLAVHVAQERGQKHPYERIFRSAITLLMDTAIQEFDFLVDFFGSGSDHSIGIKRQAQPLRDVGKSIAAPAPVPLEDNKADVSGQGSDTSAGSSGLGSGASPANGKQESHGRGIESSSESEPDSDDESKNRSQEVKRPAAPSRPLGGVASPQFAAVDESGSAQTPSLAAAPRARSSSGSNSVDRVMFTNIFAKTFNLLLESLEDHLFNCHDALGLLILIRILNQNNYIMQTRHVTCLDAFHDRINMLLWPKFKMVFDAQLDSVIKMKPKLPKKGLSQPHYLTARFAEFAAGILKLNRGFVPPTDILSANLQRMRIEIDKFLARSASLLNSPKLQVIFLINNYNQILRVLRSKGVEHDDSADFFRSQCGRQVGLFVEEELTEKFGRLVAFVKKDAEFKTSAPDDAKQVLWDEAGVEDIVRQFAKSWRDGIEAIHQSVLLQFTSRDEAEQRECTDILKQILVQLLLYYQRFHEILDTHYGNRKPGFFKEMVPSPTLMYEIKKYGTGGRHT